LVVGESGTGAVYSGGFTSRGNNGATSTQFADNKRRTRFVTKLNNATANVGVTNAATKHLVFYPVLWWNSAQ
jgi:hypothetical protein